MTSSASSPVVPFANVLTSQDIIGRPAVSLGETERIGWVHLVVFLERTRVLTDRTKGGLSSPSWLGVMRSEVQSRTTFSTT